MNLLHFVTVGKRKMYGKKLWSPVVTTILHKILPSMSHYSQTKSSSIFTLSSCPILHHTKYSTSDVLRRTPNVFPKRCFNSDSADKIDVIKCWNCNVTAAKSPFLFCESCTSVQPVDQSVDYFQIFGLKKMYVFDDKNLEGMYKDWQKKLHPDLVYSKSEQEKEYAAEQSARVIDAYRTLKKPLSRAIYILNLEGVVVDEEQTISDLDFLAEVMEIREAVEEAADSQTLKKIQSEVLEISGLFDIDGYAERLLTSGLSKWKNLEVFKLASCCFIKILVEDSKLLELTAKKLLSSIAPSLHFMMNRSDCHILTTA